MGTLAGRRGRRDRAATEARILRAVGQVLARRGFRDLGINAIARQARLDKVLIYRYFGGLPGLLAAFGRQAEFWPPPAELVAANGATSARSDAVEWSTAVLKGLLRGLRARPTTQEILRWELAEGSPLTERLAAVREEQGLEMLGRMALGPELEGGLDVPALAAVLTAGITYLVLLSKTAPAWLGVPLQDEHGWRRIESAIETIVKRVMPSSRLDQVEPRGEKP